MQKIIAGFGFKTPNRYLHLLWLVSCTFVILFVCPNPASGQQALSLKDALQLALSKNPFLQAEKLNVELSHSALITAGMRSNPTFSFGTMMNPASSWYPEGTSFLSGENRQVTYGIAKPIFTANQRRFKINLALLDKKQTENNLSQFEWNLAKEVSSAWMEIWYAREKLILIEKAKANSDTLLEINKIRLRNQVITTTEFSRTQINSEQYQLMQLAGRQALRSAGNNLAILLGNRDSIILKGEEDWYPVLLPQSYDSLLHAALLNRAEILGGKSLSEKARADVALQKSLAKPVPELGLNYSPQNKTPYAGFSVAIPLPVFDKNQGEIARAKIELQQAALLTTAYEEQIAGEVKDAFDQYITFKSQWQRFAELNKKAEAVLQSVRMSYLKGGTTIIDYLEAEKSWFEMQNQYYEAVYAYRQSYLNLVTTTNYIVQ